MGTGSFLRGVVLSLLLGSVSQGQALFLRGDVNSDGEADISDAVFILQHLFLQPATISCRDAGDANDDGSMDISDAVALLDFLFRGRAIVPPPFPEIGADGTKDPLDCAEYSPRPVEPVLGGLQGIVTVIYCDRMPGPDPPGSDCLWRGESREIYVREPATSEDVEGYYLEADLPLIASTRSDESGFYEIRLPPGTYSVFLQSEGEEYCGAVSPDGKACQVTIGETMVVWNFAVREDVY